MTGERLGQWQLGEELGRGPTGAVYAALAADGSGRPAAVKVLTHPATLDAKFQAKFAAEMLPFQRLNHPNVVKYYDCGVHAGHAWYAMELVPGVSAEALLKAGPKKPGEPGLPWAADVLRVAVQLTWALKHGHHRGLLHRNLKPANVLITEQGVVKLADFGVAKVLPVTLTDVPADLWGSAAFLAPEQFTGKPVTRRSDLYALGGVMYALVTGRPPFAAGTVTEYVHKHCYTLPDRPASFTPDVPLDLDELICALIAKDPNRRPSTAAAVTEDLAQIRAKAERKGRPVAWPTDPGDQSGPLPALGADPDGAAAHDGRPRPLLSRPWVVAPLFALVVGLILALAFWPRPSAATLYAGAQPLLASPDPADWDRAWDDYLQPLSDRHPDQFADEVRAARQKIDDHRQLRQALARPAKAASEAERQYLRGLKLAEAGDVDGARRAWRQVRAAFGPVPAEARWVALAGVALSATESRPAPPAEVQAALEAYRALKAANDPQAPAALAALEALYRDDPAALAQIQAP